MNEGPDQAGYRAAPHHSGIPDAARFSENRVGHRTISAPSISRTARSRSHWTDEHGDWLRQTFASRPDNVVVQWLTAPAGQSVNVRISLQKSAEWSMTSGAILGQSPRAREHSKGPEAGERSTRFQRRSASFTNAAWIPPWTTAATLA